MTSSPDITLSNQIKQKAFSLGFDLCGIAPSRPLEERKNALENWCSSGMNGSMDYLTKNIDKRINPESLVPGAKSVIMTGLNYFSEKKQSGPDVPVISRYAYGKSYQDVITGKLQKLLSFIKSIEPGTEGRSFSDTAPLLEKAWAGEAGLGWQGKHSIVINREIGSFFFIGALIVDIELGYDKPMKREYCGNCRICIDQCPTKAINDNRTIDTRKCIANLTIEERGPIPADIIPKLGGRVYGCDICQEVCPWNKNARENNNPEFKLSDEIAQMNKNDWVNLSPGDFKRLFYGTPIARRKYHPFMKNVTIVTNSGR
jgi:epoxyqueuosine reductase